MAHFPQHRQPHRGQAKLSACIHMACSSVPGWLSRAALCTSPALLLLLLLAVACLQTVVLWFRVRNSVAAWRSTVSYCFLQASSPTCPPACLPCLLQMRAARCWRQASAPVVGTLPRGRHMQRQRAGVPLWEIQPRRQCQAQQRAVAADNVTS